MKRYRLTSPLPGLEMMNVPVKVEATECQQGEWVRFEDAEEAIAKVQAAWELVVAATKAQLTEDKK